VLKPQGPLRSIKSSPTTFKGLIKSLTTYIKVL